jgi:tetratricopeptide (TPR) repeat protein
MAALALASVALAALFTPSHAGQQAAGGYEVIIKRAEALERAGEVEKALHEYRLAMKADPSKAEPWAKAGMLYLILKKPDAAMDASAHAVELDPGHRGAWLNKSVTELSSGMHSKALSTTEAALKRFPGDTDIMNNMATAFIGLGKLNHAEDILLEALKIKPGDSSLNYNLACTYALSSINRGAIIYLERAITLDPSLKKTARGDPDLKGIRELKPFKELTSE